MKSVCIGSHQPQNSYLNISSIMSAVDLTGAEAIHPGYGFLSENAKFSEIVSKHGIKFIGPSAEIISKMGDKIEAKKIAKKFGLPVIEGSEGGVKSFLEAKSICKNIGYPVLIKAAGGGGGKGMKIVNEESQLENLFLTAKSEAKKFFNNDELYIEKYFKNPRHIEVQVMSGKNKTVHLAERDCSVQRRHQKLIEETPSPVLTDEVRKDLFEKTVKMVEQINYEGAGTVEFIYENGKFYFLENEHTSSSRTPSNRNANRNRYCKRTTMDSLHWKYCIKSKRYKSKRAYYRMQNQCRKSSFRFST